MLRSRPSTALKQCRTILREAVGSAGGIRDICSRSLAEDWTALEHRTSRYAGDRLRTEGYRTMLGHQMSNSFRKDATYVTGTTTLQPFEGNNGLLPILPFAVRGLNTQAALLLARQRSTQDEASQRNLTRQEEDPFDAITDKIPERPVSVAEGASYSLVILFGLAIAGAAAYAVFKELVFEPKEYKIFGKALARVQQDNQVSARIGSPVTGYGQESRNRAARQRISNRVWTDEAGVEHVEVMFHIRGPGGAGKVYSAMFKDPEDKSWKYTYLIVDVTSPFPTQLMLESYVPPLAPLSAL